MIIIFLLLILCSVYKMKFAKIHEDYIGQGQTESMKGIFAVIIFLSHFRQYTENTFFGDGAVIWFLKTLSQLMVTLFFFYSGYGIMRSYQSKPNYTKGFLRKRVIKTLVRFDIAVLVYFVLSLILGTYYGVEDYLLCWIGWTSIGNSNWFVFVMLSLYAITWIVFRAIRRDNSGLIISLCVCSMSVVLWIFLALAGKESWWYNTLLCYPFGMLFAVMKPRFDVWLQDGRKYYGISLLAAAIFVALFKLSGQVAYSLLACAFCVIVVLVNVRRKIDNPVLRWLGKHAFSIYIMQRIPMIICTAIGLHRYNILFLIISLGVTFALSVAYERVFANVSKLTRI